MFLKYDLKDPINNHIFNGVINLNQIIQIIRPRLWSEIWLVTPNPERITLYKSPREENVDEVYEHIINQLIYYKKNDQGISVTLAGGLGTMEIL